MFCQLDVVKTVKKLLKDNDFWISDEFRESLEGGEFLKIDYNYFAKIMLNLLGSRRRDIEDLMKKYIRGNSFTTLCPLLHNISEKELIIFIGDLVQKPTNMREELFSYNWDNFEDLLYYNCLLDDFRPRLSNYIMEENQTSYIHENYLIKGEEQDILQHSITRNSLINSSMKEKIRFILLEAFLIYIRIKCYDFNRESMENLLNKEGILFERVWTEFERKKKKRKNKKKER